MPTFPESEWTSEDLNEWYEAAAGADDPNFATTQELRDALGAGYEAMEAGHGDVEVFFYRDWKRQRIDIRAEYRRQFEARRHRQAEVENNPVLGRLVSAYGLGFGVLGVLIVLAWWFSAGPGSSDIPSDTPTAAVETVQLAETVVVSSNQTEIDTDGETTAGETQNDSSSGGSTVPGPTIPGPNDPGVELRTFNVDQGSYIFTVEVEGNGRELATATNTRWYAPRFIVTTVSGSFVVDARWSGARDFRGRAFVGADLNDLIVDATVTGEWLADDTFVVVAVNLGIDDALISATIELTVRVTEEAGGNIDYEDTLTWEP